VLESTDEVFKNIGYLMKLNEVAYRTANDAGLEPGTDAFYKKVAEVRLEPSNEVHAEGKQFAQYQTFTDDLTNKYALAAKGIQDTPLGRYFIPFLRTPLKIVTYGLQRLPTGLLMKDFRAGGKQRDLAISRIAFGSTAAGLLAMSSNNYDDEGNYRPMFTGGGPTDRDVAAMWRQYGIEPYSIYDRKTDTYKPYDWLEPAGSIIATWANGIEIYNNTDNPEDKAELAMAMSLSIAEYTSDKSYMQGLQRLLQAVDGEGGSNIASMVAMFSPSATGQMSKLAKDIDPTMRETKDVTPVAGSEFLGQVIAKIQARSPLWSESLKPKTDVFGGDLKWGEPTFYMHSISPAMARPMMGGATAIYARELVANRVGLSAPAPVIRVQNKYTRKALPINLLQSSVGDKDGETLFYEYRQAVGQLRLLEISKEMKTKYYRSAPDQSPERAERLRIAMSRGKSIATEKFIKKYPTLIKDGIIAEASGGAPRHVLPAGIPDSIIQER